MEEGEEEQWADDDIIVEYGAFNDTAIEETKEEVGAKENVKVKRRRSNLIA
jgi:hypothetical protein